MPSRSKKQKLLLEKAIELFAQNGILTVRQLAKATGMNIAAVNYYYGNKANLMKDIEHYIMDSINDIALELNKEQISPREYLERLLLGIIDFFLNKPGTVRYFYSVLGLNSEENLLLLSESINSSNIIPQTCCNIIKEITGINDMHELYNRYLIAMSSLAPPFILGMLDQKTMERLSQNPDVKNLSIKDVNADAFKDYVQTIISLVLSKPAS